MKNEKRVEKGELDEIFARIRMKKLKNSETENEKKSINIDEGCTKNVGESDDKKKKESTINDENSDEKNVKHNEKKKATSVKITDVLQGFCYMQCYREHRE